jgi:CDP-diacylglycerol--glycerol-3-phosphate 3-phosphatidyltransferase
MGFLAVVLLPVFTPPATHVAAALFGLPLLVGFARDWLSVSGWWKPAAPRPESTTLQRLASHWLPLGARLAMLLGAALVVRAAITGQSGAALVFGAAFLLVTLMVVLGVAGRTTAVLGMCLLAINPFDGAWGLPQTALLACYALILFLGPGSYAVWAPEERWVYRGMAERTGGR